MRQVLALADGGGGEPAFDAAFEEGLSDRLGWDDLHMSLARGHNSHGKSFRLGHTSLLFGPHLNPNRWA